MSRAAGAVSPKAHPSMVFIAAQLDLQGKNWEALKGVDRSMIYRARKALTHLRVDQTEKLLSQLGFKLEIKRSGI